jgi:hypothetical protein
MTMSKRVSRSFYILKSRLWHRYQKEQDKERKDDYRLMHDIAQDAEEEYNRMLRDMEMQAIRNPGFPGDMVGRPDDDFEPPDKDEKKDEDKKND